MDVDTTPEPLEDVLSISPAPADEENPPGSSDESESESEEEGVKSGGGTRPRQDGDELPTMDTDDDVADDEVLLPLEVPAGYSLVSTAPAALTRALVHQEILLRLGMGWLRGVITRKAQARTSDRYDFRVFLETDGSTRSVNFRWQSTRWTGPRQRDLGRCYRAALTTTLQRTARARTRTSLRASCRSRGGGGGVDGGIESAGGGGYPQRDRRGWADTRRG